MRFVLGALALAGMTAGVSAQAPKPVEAPRPHAGAQREAPGDLGMAIMSARVRSNGFLIDGAGVLSAVRNSAGVYSVTFGRNVANCTTAATANAFLFGLSTINEDNRILVYSYRNGINEFADAGFSLVVYCHR